MTNGNGMALCQLQPLVRNLQSLDRDFAGLAIKRRAFPFARPTFAEVPTQGLAARFVEQDDGAAGALSLAVNDFLAPFPERFVFRPPALEHNVVVLHQSGELAHGALL